MSRNWALLACVLGFWGGLTGTPVYGQILAMPPSMAIEGPSLGTGSGLTVEPPEAAGELPAVVQTPPSAVLTAPSVAPPGIYGSPTVISDVGVGEWTCQPLPVGLIYHTYLASGREPRLAAQFVHEKHLGWLLDGTVGSQVGILRYGTRDPIRPEGWQLDVEGAAFPRLALEDGRNLVSSDFRVGVPLTFRRDWFESKLAAYHLSSHLSDIYSLYSPLWPISYSRDAVVLGVGIRPWESFRLYGEADWAFHTTGFSKPWQFQFGAEFSPLSPSGFHGSPFFAINGLIREENDYSGNFTVQTGWQWRGQAGQLLRAGFHYLNGKSNQGQFFANHEEQIGMGLWYDF